jgi:ABC-type transporter Mla MlaB component
MVIASSLARRDLSALCLLAYLRLQRSGADVLVCDIGSARPDAVAIDLLARLQLTARRAGRCLRVQGAPHELLQLAALVGLAEVLRL